MADRDQRKRTAAKHTSLMKGVFASDIAACVASVKVFEDGQGRELAIPEPRFEKTATRVTMDFAPKALYAAQGKAVLIDPASFTRPGGSYEEGGFGPEQVLCSESDLYPILCGIKKVYHDKNRGWESGQLYTDRAAYLSGVTFSRNGETRNADVVVIAAPNRKRAMENNRSVEGCDQALGFRIEAMLRVAASGGADVLICGAFGCGPQGNADAQVIALIKAWLDAHPGVFEQVVFAVPRSSFDAFEEAFGAAEPEEQPAEAAPEEADEDDEDDWRNIELPEGVTLG